MTHTHTHTTHTHTKYTPLNYSARKQHKIVQKYFQTIYLYITFAKLDQKIKLLKLISLFTLHLNVYIVTKHIICICGLPLDIILYLYMYENYTMHWEMLVYMYKFIHVSYY